MPAKLYVSLAFSVAVWFLPAAFLSFFAIRRRAKRVMIQPRSKAASSLFILALLVVGYLAFYLQFRFVFFTIAASHVRDIDPALDHWLTWFFWGSYALPITWAISVIISLLEFFGHRRCLRVILCGASPLIVAVVYFACWQFYLALLP